MLADDTGIATITDNDTPSLSIDDVTVDEAADSALFIVTRLAHADHRVDFASAEATAIRRRLITRGHGRAGPS